MTLSMIIKTPANAFVLRHVERSSMVYLLRTPNHGLGLAFAVMRFVTIPPMANIKLTPTLTKYRPSKLNLLF